MRIEQMADFIEISRHSSLAAAAKALYVTPQALSASLNSMEKEIGSKLFVRGQFGIELTEKGKSFLELAHDIVKTYEQGMQLIQNANSKSPIAGTLDIYGNLVFRNVLLPQFLMDFNRNYADLNICTYTKDRNSAYETMISKIKEKQYDVVSFFGKMGIKDKYFDTETQLEDVDIYSIITGSLTACVAVDSPLAKYKTLSLKTIATYPLVLFSMDGQGDYGKLFEKYGKIRVLLQTDSITAWMQTLKEQYCIALIQDNVLSRSHQLSQEFIDEKYVQIRIVEDVCCDVCMMTPKIHSPIVSEVIKYFSKEGTHTHH
jgi:DNA-binding transcriptional LysR family regulator